MNYTSISIQGNILSSEIFEKIRLEDTRFQNAKDFGLNPSASVRDEINNAWSLALTNWQIFKQKREALGPMDTGTTETRKNWMLPLLQILGFEAGTAAAELINNKSYAVSHRASNKDGFPIHIVGINQSLDKRPDSGGARLSPHALIQEYINNTEHLYGIATNGAMLRILRDATRLSRLSYVEFNLEQMMEEGHFAEFALMYRALHSSRFANKKEENADSIFEWYHQEALSSGSRIREKLSSAVEHSIVLLANGLLENPNNQELRTQLADNKISAQQYYLFVLRTVYRILFLLVIEERKLIYPEKLDAETQRKREIYFSYYSIQRLSKLIQKNIYIDPRKTDLWQSLITTFRLFEYKDMGNKLGISALGSGIFQPSALGGMEEQLLSNETLLKVLQYLLTFQNDNGQLVRVNYADLDVEEFGSIYEGLLEYAPEVKNDHFNFVKGNERSSSGSHYTPEELVKPLITHSLDYLIADKLKEADPEAGLLSLTICDVACGSGHILLSAARRVGFELAKVRSGEDQPTPSVLRIAIRDVIKNCIYGVDLNPLAVELCKVALWLEAHEPGQPLNFLDHHIKNGNAIVGLAHFEELETGIASEAFKALPGDDKSIASALKKRNELERKAKLLSAYDVENVDHDLKDLQKEFLDFARLPENTAEQIAAKEKAYQKLTEGKKWFRLKQLADLQVAQFYIPKTDDNKMAFTTQSQYLSYLKTSATIYDRGASMAVAAEKKIFHWFLEFPQVFMNGGFDCILGNPPYLGGKKLSGAFGNSFLEFIYHNFPNSGGLTDLISYFIRRNFKIIHDKGYVSLIVTKSVSEGDTRKSGLSHIIEKGAQLHFVVRSIVWPGQANVNVALLSFTKSNEKKICLLDNIKVDHINSYFEDELEMDEPFKLFENQNGSYIGSVVNGKGFILDKNEAKILIEKNSKNKLVIKPFLVGDDLNSDPFQNPSRFVIDFYPKSLKESINFTLPFEIVKEKVKPLRDSLNKKTYREKWWLFAEQCANLYKQANKSILVVGISRVTKHLKFSEIDKNPVFSDAVVVFTLDQKHKLGVLDSNIHGEWAFKYSSGLGATLRYTPSRAFEAFPFPMKSKELEIIAIDYLNKRKQVAQTKLVGLTNIYNEFHNKSNNDSDINVLRVLQDKLDEIVLKAYGWQDIALRHDFYEVDYLPENDRVRYTIHPDARKEVLKRLLELNHKIHAEEVAAGLWDKKKPAKKEPAAKSKNTKAVAKDTAYQSPELFEEANLFNQEIAVTQNCRVTVKNTEGKIFRYHITPKAEKGMLTSDYKQIAPDSRLAEILSGKSPGETIEFEEELYRVEEIR